MSKQAAGALGFLLDKETIAQIEEQIGFWRRREDLMNAEAEEAANDSRISADAAVSIARANASFARRSSACLDALIAAVRAERLGRTGSPQ